jgi:acyl dehydratase
MPSGGHPAPWFWRTNHKEDFLSVMRKILSHREQLPNGGDAVEPPAERACGIGVGVSASLRHVFTQHEVDAFAALTGDDNPLHQDGSVARSGRFGGPIVHGLLVAALIGRLLGTELPGAGTIYKRQVLHFVRPVHVGRPVEARVEVLGIGPDGRVLTLRTQVFASGCLAVDGEADVVLARSQGAASAE